MSPGDSNLDYITHFIVQTSDNGLTWDTLLENGTNVVKVCILYKPVCKLLESKTNNTYKRKGKTKQTKT
jgi:hypothetical protein